MDLSYRRTLDLAALMLDQLHVHYRREYIRLVTDALRAGVITNDKAISLLYRTWQREFPGRRPPSVPSSYYC